MGVGEDPAAEMGAGGENAGGEAEVSGKYGTRTEESWLYLAGFYVVLPCVDLTDSG